ncbi:MAG: methyltransferase domain-containing protein [candidate division Zixibacteria bacterium]|nr:methyltransferase domain-containing protein [candidate division Zixibacteria bacterium]
MPENKHSVCPWWYGYFLDNPIMRFLRKPDKTLKPYLKKGMTVLDIGCGMGLYSIAAAEIVGDGGKVYAVDLQEKMLRGLNKRAKRLNIADRIETRNCISDTLCVDDIAGKVNFALAMHVVHEVPDQLKLFREVHSSLAPGGYLLVAEPSGHVSASEFESTLAIAKEAGFNKIDSPQVARSSTALLEKQ